MSRLAVFTWVWLVAVFCLAQQPSDPAKPGNPGTSNAGSQGSAGQSSSSPNSSKQGSATPDSSQPLPHSSNPDSSTKASPGQASPSQASPGQTSPDQASPSQTTPGDSDTDESSSHDTRTDISPPVDDEKNHPNSKSAVGDLEPKPADASDVQEFHPWNPMKSMKDVEVGDYYFKRKNYRAALDRYKEALFYKNNDAIATYRLAVCQEKVGDKAEARKNFEQYLKILPEGPYAKDARASLDKLGPKADGDR